MSQHAAPEDPGPVSTGLHVAFEHAARGEDLADQWRALGRTASPSFFISWRWMGVWLDLIDEPVWLATISAGAEIVAMGFVMLRDEVRHGLLPVRRLYLNQTGDADKDSIFIEYNGLLCRADRREEALRALINALGGPDAPRELRDFDEIHLGGVLQSDLKSIDFDGLTTSVRAKSETAMFRNTGGVASLDDYLSKLSSNSRQQIRRAMRLYEQRGALALTRPRDGAGARAFFSEMKRLHQAYWTGRGKAGAFATPFHEAFHRRLIDAALAEGGVEIVRVTAGDFVLGYFYNLLTEDWAGSYMSGIAYEEDARLKPGLVAFALLIADHLKSGRTIFDFMAGDARYKRSLGNHQDHMLWLDLQRPRLKLRAESALRWAKQRLGGEKAAADETPVDEP